jgi:integrase
LAAPDRPAAQVATAANGLRQQHVRSLGRLRVQEIGEEAILALIADMQRNGYANWTIRGALTPLGRIMGYAVRRGIIPVNPMVQLERGARPSVAKRTRRRSLTTEEVGRLLGAALPMYRPLLACAVYTGMRLGELLGLTWEDVDFEAGFVRVRKQADRKTRARVEPKTAEAVRDVVLLPQLARLLREHKAASPHSRPSDPVFASREGRPLHYRNVSARGVEKAADRAGLNRDGAERVTMHTLRRTFVSHLILDLKLDALQVSKQVGHARPSITQDRYADLFDAARHADDIRERMAGSAFGRALDGNVLETPTRTQPHHEDGDEGAEVVELQAFRT